VLALNRSVVVPERTAGPIRPVPATPAVGSAGVTVTVTGGAPAGGVVAEGHG
jgi:hypothetical protein